MLGKFRKMEKDLLFHEVEGKIYFVMRPLGPVYEIPPRDKEKIYELVRSAGDAVFRNTFKWALLPVFFGILIFATGFLMAPEYSLVFALILFGSLLFGGIKILKTSLSSRNTLKAELAKYPDYPLNQMKKKLSKARADKLSSAFYFLFILAGLFFLGLGALIADANPNAPLVTIENIKALFLAVAGLVMAGAGLVAIVKRR